MREELQEREDWHAEQQQRRQAEFRALRQRQLRDHNLDDSIAVVCRGPACQRRAHQPQDGLDAMPADMTAPFDREAARRAIIERFKDCKRRPGDPRLRVELSESIQLTAASECPPAELDRRHRMQDFFTFVKIVVNAKEVSRTRAAPLQKDFAIPFEEMFSLKLAAWPSSIAMQVWEANAVHGEIFISEVFLNVPPTSATQANTELASLEFASDRVLRFDFVESSRVRAS